MKHLLRISLAAVVLTFGLQAAHAACYAEYKAKQDSPLKLHVGVMKVGNGDCPSRKGAEGEVAARLARNGWTLLTVQDVFDDSGLEGRKQRAGAYYLRY